MNVNSQVIKREDRIQNYLAALSMGGHKVDAAKQVSVPPSTLTNWRNSVTDFKEREAAAMEEFRGMLFHEAVDRAINGWEKPVIHQGDFQYAKNPATRELLMNHETGEFIKVTQTVKDNALLIKLLEAHIAQFNKNPQTLIAIGGMDEDAPTIRVMFGPDNAEEKTVDDVDAVDAEFTHVEEEEEADIYS